MPRPAPSDTVPAMLTPGEAVLNREAAELLGRDKIKQINQAGLQMRQRMNGVLPPPQGYVDGATLVQPNTDAQGAALAAGRANWQEQVNKYNAGKQAASSTASAGLQTGSSYNKTGTSYSDKTDLGMIYDPRLDPSAVIKKADPVPASQSVVPKPVSSTSGQAPTYYQQRQVELGNLSLNSTPKKLPELTVHVGDSYGKNMVGGITDVGEKKWAAQAALDATKPTVAVGGGRDSTWFDNKSSVGYPSLGAPKPAMEQSVNYARPPEPAVDLMNPDVTPGVSVVKPAAPVMQPLAMKKLNDFSDLQYQGYVNGTEYASQQEADLDTIKRAAAGESSRPVNVPPQQVRIQRPGERIATGRVAESVMSAPRFKGGVTNDDVRAAAGQPVNTDVVLPKVKSGSVQPSVLDKQIAAFTSGKSDSGERVGDLMGNVATVFPQQVKPEVNPTFNRDMTSVDKPSGPGFLLPKNQRSSDGSAGIDWGSAGQAVGDSVRALSNEYLQDYKNYGPVGGLIANVGTMSKQIGRGYSGMDELITNGVIKPWVNNVVKPAFGVKSTNTPRFKAGDPTKDGSTEGRESPAIDMPNPSINTKGLPPRPDYAAQAKQDAKSYVDQMATQNKGKATSNGKSGSFSYVQDGRGNIVKVNNETGEMGAIADNINRTTDTGGRSFWQNMGYEGGAAQYRAEKQQAAQQAMQQAQYNMLLEQALSGPSGDMSPAEFGAAKRRQASALKALDVNASMQNNDASLKAHAADRAEQRDLMRSHYQYQDEQNRREAERQSKIDAINAANNARNATKTTMDMFADLNKNSKDPEAEAKARQRYLMMQSGGADLMKMLGIPIRPEEVQSQHLYKFQDLDRKAQRYAEELKNPGVWDEFWNANTLPKTDEDAYMQALRAVASGQAPADYL